MDIVTDLTVYPKQVRYWFANLKQRPVANIAFKTYTSKAL